MIKAQEIVDWFKYALENHWGYCFGAHGGVWTASDQKLKVNYMIKNFGEDWKKNADAKKNNYYLTAMYGAKWIGHNVSDCSGMFVWVYKKYGLAIQHSSSGIYKSYCKEKGKLTADIKKTLLPGTAVFTGDTATNHPHIGLYVGNGKCIEAAGVESGVITSNITAGKWKWYGMLKDVIYEAPDGQKPVSDVSDDKTIDPVLPTLKRGSKGEYVTLMQTKLHSKGYDLGLCGIDGDFGRSTENAVKAFQKDSGLKVDGICGHETWKCLMDTSASPLYTVHIPFLTKPKADALIAQYSGSWITNDD